MVRVIAVMVAFSFFSQALAAGSGPLVLIDHRLANEDRPRTLSNSVFSCAYGIRVLSDEGRSRTRVAALDAALRSRLGSRLGSHSVTLTSYQVYFNYAAGQMSAVRSIAAGSAGGIATGTARLVPKCSEANTPDGWFDPSELANDNPPFVSEIEASVDGRPISVRSVFSPSKSLKIPATAFSGKAAKNFADAKSRPEVDRAIDKANADFVTQVGQLIGSSSRVR